MIVLQMEKAHFRYDIKLSTFSVFILFRHQIYGVLAMESFFGILNGFLVRFTSLYSLFCQLDSNVILFAPSYSKLVTGREQRR